MTLNKTTFYLVRLFELHQEIKSSKVCDRWHHRNNTWWLIQTQHPLSLFILFFYLFRTFLNFSFDVYILAILKFRKIVLKFFILFDWNACFLDYRWSLTIHSEKAISMRYITIFYWIRSINVITSHSLRKIVLYRIVPECLIQFSIFYSWIGAIYLLISFTISNIEAFPNIRFEILIKLRINLFKHPKYN